MRILIISNYYPPLEIGGWEQLTRDIAVRLQQRGHEISVLTSNYQAGNYQNGTSNVARILHLESPDHTNYRPYYTLSSHRTERSNRQHLAQTVAEFQPDIIFIHGMWNLPHSLALQAEQICPDRVVYYMASHWPTEQDHHTAYWQHPAERSWRRPFKQALSALICKLVLPGTPRNRLRFRHVLCVSEFIRTYLVEHAGVPRTQTQVIYNGIEPSIFMPKDKQPSRSYLRLLCAGQIAAHKGVHTAIESLALLQQADPEMRVILSLVGGGPAEYEQLLKQNVRQLNISHAVQFCGRVPREQMPAILADHDVLLLPSIWPEPLARIAQEAMACGLVVIGANTGGTPELLQDGCNGLIFEPENAAMLAEKINLIANDRQLYRRLAAAARQTVVGRFTMGRMVDEIEEYLASVVEQNEK